MTRPLIFKDARIIDEFTDNVMSIIIDNGIISDIVHETSVFDLNNFEIIECSGMVIIPGIVDIHVHFREPGYEHKETIETGLMSAAAGGITTVVCQPNTSPAIDNVETINFILNKAKRISSVNLHCYGAVTNGISGKVITNIRGLAEKGAVGFTDDGNPVFDSLILKEALIECGFAGVPLAQHAEDKLLSKGGSVNKGFVSESLNDVGIPNISEYFIVKRDLDILRSIKNAHYHLLHVSTKEAIDEIRIAKKQGLNVTCEVTPHHFKLNDLSVLSHGGMAKMNPPLRAEEDRLAAIEGLVDGTIDCIATDHAPHEIESKCCSVGKALFGIVGMETLFPLSLELYHSGFMSINKLVAKLTSAPAKIINKKVGLIKKGYPADFTIVDLNAENTIDIKNFKSKSNNSPFNGLKLKGKVLMTVANGDIVYRQSIF